MNPVLQFWLTFYGVVGICTWLFMVLNYDFLEGTPWWRRILSQVFVLVLWPVIVITLMFVA